MCIRLHLILDYPEGTFVRIDGGMCGVVERAFPAYAEVRISEKATAFFFWEQLEAIRSEDFGKRQPLQ